MNANNESVEIYETSELELAAFLKARGHRLVGARPAGNCVTFSFAANGTREDAERFFEGAETNARELFSEHRGLRSLIKKVKEHASQVTGTERTYEHTQHSR